MTNHTKLKRFVALGVSTLVLGVVVGAMSGLLALLLEGVEQLFLGFQEDSGAPGPVAVAPWRRLVSVTIGGVVVAVAWWLLRNRTRRVPSVTEAVTGEDMPWWQTLIHVVTQIFFVGTGASIGREVAPREAGSMIAQVWSRKVLGKRASRWGLTEEDGRLLTAAAAGAGFAGVYISPLTGMFFSVEILLHKITTTSVTVSLGMAAIATYIGTLFKGDAPYYSVGEEPYLPSLLLFSLLTAPLFGLVGAGFRKATAWAESRQITSSKVLLSLPLAALVSGLAALATPYLMGNGRALSQAAMNWSASPLLPTIGLLLLLAAAKGVLTIMTIKSGASGGTLTPSIAIGASLGAILGLVTGLTVWQCAIVGAVGVLAASQQAPLMAMMMLVEITHLPVAAIVPLGLVAAVSVAVSRLVIARDTHDTDLVE